MTRNSRGMFTNDDYKTHGNWSLAPAPTPSNDRRPNMDTSILIAIIAVAGSIVVNLGTQIYNRWSRRRDELLERKKETYEKVLEPMLGYFHEVLARKKGVEPTRKRKLGALQELAFRLPLHVPDKVFRAFATVAEMENEVKRVIDVKTSTEEEHEEVLTRYYLSIGKLVLEMRADLGWKTSIKGIDIIANVVGDIDEKAEKYGLPTGKMKRDRLT